MLALDQRKPSNRLMGDDTRKLDSDSSREDSSPPISNSTTTLDHTLNTSQNLSSHENQTGSIPPLIRNRPTIRGSGSRQPRIITLPGSSQYSAGAPSSCIPSCMEACVNFLYNGGVDADALVRILCAGSLYRGTQHLEVSKVCKSILRYQSLKVAVERQCMLNWIGQAVKELSDLATKSLQPHATIITRPPESIMLATTHHSDLIVLYDSHPRPDHPTGAAFLIFSGVADASAYLERLWPDSEDKSFEGLDSWQTTLLRSVGIVSFHAGPEKMDDVILNATSTNILERDYRVLELSGLVDELGREKDREKALAKKEVDRARQEKQNAIEELKRVHESELKLRNDVHERAMLALQCRHEREVNDLIREFTDNARGFRCMQARKREDADHALAKRLQAESDRAEADRQARSFTCPVCMEVCPEDVVFPVEGCEHKFCRTCAAQFVLQDLRDRAYPCICPVCRIAPANDDAPLPKGEVAHHDVLSVLSEQDRVAWLDLERDHAILAGSRGNVFIRCRDCAKPIEVGTPDEAEALEDVTCPYCDKTWCQKCDLDEGHEEFTCAQYQAWKRENSEADDRVENLSQREGWIKCPGPNCGIFIGKNGGCNHMTCTVCHTHSCYLCSSFLCQTRDGNEIQKSVSRHYSTGGCRNRMTT